MEQQTEKTQVIILGGGITGLTAALYLAQQGVDFILIEKHIGTSIYPRARTIDVRTMELFRGLGLHEDLREGGKSLAPAWGIIRGNNLMEALRNPVGKITPGQLMEAQKELKSFAEKSPETVCRCTQDISEAIICETAKEQGLDLRFYHQMLSFEQDENEVAVLVENRVTGEQYIIMADYMIAADGANSVVRKQLDIPVSGNGSWTDLLNIYFEADLEYLVKGREFSQFLIDTPEITGFLLTINNKDKWAFHLRFYPENGDTIASYPEEKLITILRRILGIADPEISILKVLPWQLTVIIASQMRINRIFLAGDAAHTMTPYAGKGANAGVQDVQNLAWKLAAVLKHGAGDVLLDTYHAERQPVGAYYARLSGELADKNGLINNVLMVTKAKDLIGLPDYGYDSSAIKREVDLPFSYFIGEPGTRVPHLWLNESQTISSLDWIRGQFVLIANSNEGWQVERDQVEQQLNINIQLVTPNDENILEKWKELTHTLHDEALLIRPDDFVAAKLTSDNLLDVMRSILSQ
ncbi:FAD-dependent oxidoreductase [Pedobacter cryoconitis]|uniref:2-polyprenyl-6-methoxyphenol hydroxylase-like FAD-dependent oxidoreductase n=1 Tax=Pedobacter cryoconitis TaxID=188932 RepID=A0A7X0J573_9SPHI|nr:FAD-dependent oxidoreductase [Pedobacter cryoconitis]MBB6499856.1 2-polyprenyl-6-methoxyphenol hydroxylase-like FAD-dependent oxidoreductase [Pedobacter cryoconitis]